MDKLKLTGQNLGRVFNFKCGRVCLHHGVTLITKTAKFKVENLVQTTFSFSPVSFCAPRMIISLSNRPRWPWQVQSLVTGIITNNCHQFKWGLSFKCLDAAFLSQWQGLVDWVTAPLVDWAKSYNVIYQMFWEDSATKTGAMLRSFFWQALLARSFSVGVLLFG
jgi:hypothetical protein